MYCVNLACTSLNLQMLFCETGACVESFCTFVEFSHLQSPKNKVRILSFVLQLYYSCFPECHMMFARLYFN